MAHDPSVFAQPHFRIKEDDTTVLDADSGWAAAIDVNWTVDAHVRFRIRFEVEETATGADPLVSKIQINKNSTTWVDCDFYDIVTLGLNTNTPLVWITQSNMYVDGASTANILSGSSRGFVVGEGAEDPDVASIAISNQHTEIEFTIIIPTFYAPINVPNNPQNKDGDTFEFRLVESDGTVFAGAYVNPTITLNVPDYLIGGCFVETASTLGPYVDSNDNMYYMIENCEIATDPDDMAIPMMIKSTDGGKSWNEIGGGEGNRPATNDLEGIDIKQVGEVLHVAHQPGSTINYYTFHTSGHGTTPDTWVAKELNIATITATPALQNVNIFVYADTDILIFYNSLESTVEQQYFVRKTGTWGGRTLVDGTGTDNFTGQVCVMGANQLIHIFYKDDTNNNHYHKTLAEDGTLTADGSRDEMTTDSYVSGEHSMTPQGVYYDDVGVEVITIAYATEAADHVFVRQFRNNSMQSPVDASTIPADIHPGGGPGHHQICGFMAVWGKIVYLRFGKQNTIEIMETESDDGGAWSAETEEVAGYNPFANGRVIVRGGATYLAYIYENPARSGVITTPGGYTGGLIYKEILLDAGGGDFTLTADQGDYSMTGQTDYLLKRALRIVSAQGDYNITGQVANLNITLPVEQGSYTLTGQTANLDHGFIIVGDQGSYTINGQIANLNITLPVNQGSYALAGQVANLTFGFTITVDQGSYSISGQVANLLNQLVITAEQGSYTLSGQVANLDHGFIIVSEQGSYSITGQAADFLQSLVMAGAQGSYALSGQIADLDHGYILVSDQGSYALNEQAANLIRALIMAADQGSYILSGQAANLRFGFNMLADQGSYALTGQAAGLLRSLVMAAEQGAYALTGLAANLNYSGGGTTILAATGFYALTGQAASLPRALIIDGAQGSYALSGQIANLNHGFIILGNQGSYALSGQIANLNHGFIILGNQGSYALSGQIANLNQGFIILAAQGAYALTGQAAELTTGFVLTANQGSYAITGQAANFIQALIISAAQGAYTLTGQPANLSTGNVLIAAQGSYALSGQDAQFLRGYVLGAAQGAYALTGQQALLVRALIMAANQGNYSLNGQAANPYRRILTAAQGSYAYTGYDTLLDLVLAAVIDSFGTVEMLKQVGLTERPAQVGKVERE